MNETASAKAGASVSSAATQEIMDWFAEYDALVQAGDLEGMANIASFPLNEVSDNAAGHAVTVPCDRTKYIEQMREVLEGSEGVEMQSQRHPIFISPALCFVVTDASFVVGGVETQMRYGDLLVRTADGWKFQTMVAGGWHDQM
jgi:hypothetical protein